MCGIVGYVGTQNHKDILLGGLEELEYRGYDSAGIVCLEHDNFYSFKATGKLVNLKEKSKDYQTEGFAVSIGHTRWATHGIPNETNAHPHKGEFSYVVHNGIIENYKELKENLDENKFVSQTDTEVIVHLFEKNYDGCVKTAFEKTMNMLEGSYAILLVTKQDPDKVYFAKNCSPMIIGKSNDEIFFGSSDSPLIGKAKEVIYLEDGDIGYCSKGNIKFFNNKELNFQTLDTNKEIAKKEGFDSFMEKEIYEQSTVIKDTLRGRVKDDGIEFQELANIDYSDIEEIRICACGTSFHAGMVGSYLIERLTKLPCRVEIASEFRYKDPVINDKSLFVTITQSGETADTLESLKMLRGRNIKTLSICNIDNSSIVRESQSTILTRAGIEKGVASTKAFTTQVAVLWALALDLAVKRGVISDEDLKSELSALKNISENLNVNKETHKSIHELSKNYLNGHGFFFIGRDVFYPLALEGALKLKEISYLHAEGYPSGEMKHGPIALADPELFTIALCSKHKLFDKIKSNVEELNARNSKICAISQMEIELADNWIKLNKTNHYMQEFFEMTVIVQLLALEITKHIGNDVDMPRNLAKSVTVE